MTSTPLHFVGDTLRHALLAIPLPVVRALFLALLAGVLVWVLMLPRSETTEPDGDDQDGDGQDRGSRGGVNLKVGATIALVLQLAIYSLL